MKDQKIELPPLPILDVSQFQDRNDAILGEIKHSIRQARIPGNDWRRELALIEGIVDAQLSTDVQPAAPVAQEPVALVRVTEDTRYGGKRMEVLRNDGAKLPEGDHYVYAAPQPVEPVKHPSYDSDCCQGHKAKNKYKCAEYDAETVKVPSDADICGMAIDHETDPDDTYSPVKKV